VQLTSTDDEQLLGSIVLLLSPQLQWTAVPGPRRRGAGHRGKASKPRIPTTSLRVDGVQAGIVTRVLGTGLKGLAGLVSQAPPSPLTSDQPYSSRGAVGGGWVAIIRLIRLPEHCHSRLISHGPGIIITSIPASLHPITF